MKKYLFVIFTAFFSALMCIGVSASDGWKYESGTIVVQKDCNMEFELAPWTEYLPNAEKIVIESGVTHIPAGAFSQCRDECYTKYEGGYYLGNETNPYLVLIKGADGYEIHPNTAVIADEAFFGCKSETAAELPESVISIGKRAFFASGVTEVSIPAATGYIFGGAFSACDRLEQIKIAYSNSSYRSYGDALVENGTDRLIYTSGRIPEDVKIIGDWLFYGTDAETVQLPDSVTEIGAYAFAESQNLQSFYTGTDFLRVGESAFANCQKLSDVKLNMNTEQISQEAFIWCSSLKELTIPYGIKKIGNNAFAFTEFDNLNYEGSESGWQEVDVGSGNEALENIRCLGLYGTNDENNNNLWALSLAAVCVIAAVTVLLSVLTRKKKKK